MSTNLEKQIEHGHDISLMPGWLSGRMMAGGWAFGLLTVNGTVICVERIDKIWQAANGDVWFDVTLLRDCPISAQGRDSASIIGGRPFVAPTERVTASVNASHVVAAYELADK
jgi:hypothetical protein